MLLYSQNAEDLGDKTMEEKLLLEPNNGKQNYPCVDQNHWLDSLDLRSLQPTNHNLLKVPKNFELLEIELIKL